MALAFVQANSASAVGCAYLSNVTNGNLLLAIGRRNGGFGGITSFGDTQTNTWTTLIPASFPDVIIGWAVAKTTGANTVTPTQGTATSVSVYEYSGQNATPIDQVVAVTAVSGAPTNFTGNLTLNFTNEWVFNGGCVFQAITATSPDGSNIRINSTTNTQWGFDIGPTSTTPHATATRWATSSFGAEGFIVGLRSAGDSPLGGGTNPATTRIESVQAAINSLAVL